MLILGRFQVVVGVKGGPGCRDAGVKDLGVKGQFTKTLSLKALFELRSNASKQTAQP